MTSFFDKVVAAPPDPILGLTAAFEADPRKIKVNLSVGIYRTAELKSKTMDCVKKAEKIIFDEEENKEYLPIHGHMEYVERVGEIVFGKELFEKIRSRTFGSQSVGGTGALRIGGEFLSEEIGKVIFLSNPTWSNHRNIFPRSGMKIETYPYYNSKKRKFDCDKMIEFLEELQNGSIILLHACCHNPTGSDPSHEEWEKISSVLLKKRHLPFFDFAYQGFGDGYEKDAFAVRLFAEMGHEMLIATSYSKTFGLYAERIGALFVIAKTDALREKLGSRIKAIIRANYSNPPLHGAKVISHVLGSSVLRQEWLSELSHMRDRIIEMRRALTSALISKSSGIDFSYLNERKGLFSFCDLNKEQVDRLIHEFGIYMTSDGRINVVGLNANNLDYVSEAIIRVCL